MLCNNIHTNIHVLIIINNPNTIHTITPIMSYWYADNAQLQEPRRCHQAIERVIPNNDTSILQTTRKFNIQSANTITTQSVQSAQPTFKPLDSIVRKSQHECNRHSDMLLQQKQYEYKQLQALFYNKLDYSAQQSLYKRNQLQSQHEYNSMIQSLKSSRKQKLQQLYRMEQEQYNRELADRGLILITT